ncbi:hypothetical protein EHS25_006457 [Saitozyma podzolica]|uniref:Tetratricopeptide SHNi-TPR domain-containing protein n=1 Tax=Saitozyma podzolica TaxID=1890683 RepID=A0A427YRY0_9TREE|nr:hypothetical protein EHS25_006457 [Saitozyma podzolica]
MFVPSAPLLNFCVIPLTHLLRSSDPTQASDVPAPVPASAQEEVVADTKPAVADADPAETRAQADKLIAEGKKAIALKSWDEGVAKYADALDLIYGKALYELAFSQQGVMGKEEVAKETEPALEAEASGSNFVESAEFDDQEDDAAEGAGTAPEGDGEGDDANATTSNQVGDTSIAQSAAPDEEVDEPEDDYNAAWEVLDVARTIYARMVEGKQEGEAREERLCLAECYLALGDVSCETENFPQAVQDYSSALSIKQALLPPSSRALASVHYQLATVLEFTPNRRSDALSHVEKALEGFKARLSELSGDVTAGDEVSKLSDKDKEAEKKDVQALLGDLEVKIEELKAAPPAEDIVSESINHLLGQPSSSGGVPAQPDNAPVNDLTGMVKKKKKPAAAPVPTTANGEEAANGKRKAEEEVGGEEKKAKAAE